MSEALKIADRMIKIVIASPSDVVRERELLLNHLPAKFTRYKYEELCNARIIVEGWEDVPSQTGYAQDIINSTLIKNADIVIAIFRHKLGGPTINIKTGNDRSPSGTAEELLYAIKKNKKNKRPIGMAFFYAKPPFMHLFSFKIKKEWKRLEDFKKEIVNEILYKLYDDDEDELLRTLCKDICQLIRTHKILAVQDTE